jgi:MmyB-like transcription regulator ligand binding domain
MCPSLLRHLRASHADCTCHEPSAAICLKLRASAIPSGRATGMIHLRGSRAHRVVAEFRAAVTGYSDDPDIRRLVDELRIGSSDFERCWETQGVLAREGGERAFNHPTMGLLHYQQVSLSLAGWPDYRLTMLLSAPTVRNR